ncbi:MAG: YbjQ family protein [Coriobacteriia bacterium]|nr:YbjQ family protein [Coriobacteriia bacterium]
MIVTTVEQIHERKILSTLGLAKGSTVRARHIGRDITASFRGLVGGEITEYTKMMAEAREEALARMIKDAESMGAHAVIGMRFGTSMVMTSAAEVTAYGTAVTLEG